MLALENLCSSSRSIRPANRSAGAAIGETAVVELVVNWPGMGLCSLTPSRRDYPVIMGTTLVVGLVLLATWALSCCYPPLPGSPNASFYLRQPTADGPLFWQGRRRLRPVCACEGGRFANGIVFRAVDIERTLPAIILLLILASITDLGIGVRSS